MKLQHPDGNETYYKASGNSTANTLLLLHGIGADHAMWQPQIEDYTAAGFHILVPDLFGHGRSSKLNQLDLKDWHRQINGLLNHHRVTQCTLIGTSMGGVIAQSYVVHYPEKVTCLIVADSFGELHTLPEKILGFSAIAGITLSKLLPKLLGRKLLVKGIKSTYKAPYTQRAQAYFENVTSAIDLDQLLLARKAINRIDVLKKLNDITIPALIIVGEDFGEAFIDINQKIAEALPNAKFVILKNAMDPSNLVNPLAFNQQVLNFIEQT